MTKRRRYTQKEMVIKLQGHGWRRVQGGKHQVKMTKVGNRPITIPMLSGSTLPVGLSQAILKQAGIEDEP